MKRNYQNGIHEKMCYFVGYEVEKTPVHQQKTLFIEGIPRYGRNNDFP